MDHLLSYYYPKEFRHGLDGAETAQQKISGRMVYYVLLRKKIAEQPRYDLDATS